MKAMKKKHVGVMIAAFGLVTVGSVNASPITVINSSFEDPVLLDNQAVVSGGGVGTINGWNFAVQTGGAFQDAGIENPEGAYTGSTGSGTPSGADGINVCFLNQEGGGLYAGIFQDVGGLQANTTYTFTIAIGQRLDRVNGSVEFGLYNDVSGVSDIWNTATLLNSNTGVSSVNGEFQDFQVAYTTGGSVSDNLYIGMRYVGDGTIQASFDNARLDAIPEPATIGLIGICGIGCLIGRRFFMM
ncbi:MAG: hypothetical protein JXR25_15710 [Pontiellaceae bacterium]|nr:hypothetical protein [Pontiellaceae bacterium]MBN2786267.1 hypothetical protein [Pontiellaceae bacterium]